MNFHSLQTLTLSGNNTLSGPTSIGAGIVNYRNGTAFGTNSAIAVSDGASAQVQGGIAGGRLALILGGVGDTVAGATGALENASGNNGYAGPITLTDATTISSDSGTLSLTGATIAGSGENLTLAGAGNGSIANQIETGVGTVTKSGEGSWAVFANESYSGATAVTGGIFEVDGLLSESASTSVTNAKLTGTGTITNSVTIGNGAGSVGSAIIAPGTPGTTGTLTTGQLTLKSDGVYVFSLDSTGGGKGRGADEIIATSVNLDSNAQFTFNDLALTPGKLTPGKEFIIIATTGGLTGEFGNLANYTQFTSGPNIFEAIYNSDDLMLAVAIPEPQTWAILLCGLGMLAMRARRREKENY